MGNGNGVRLKVVTTLHGTDVTIVGQDRSYLPITRWSIDQSDAVTAVSQYLKDVTIREFGVKRPIEVLPNFVDTKQYHPGGASPFARTLAGEDEALLVHVSNFRPVKRVGDVLAVFERVQKAMPARLLLIGDGPERSLAERLAREGGFADEDHVPRQRRRDRDDPPGRPPAAASVGRRVLRARRPRGHGLRRAGHRHREGRTARRSSRTGSTGISGRSATSRAWRRRR